MILEYPAKLLCSVEEFYEEFHKAWACLGHLWLAELNACRNDQQTPSQLSVIKKMLDQSSVQYPNVCQFLQIMLCTPPNTSPVERGYTYLQMVATKRRNHLSSENLETLFLLVALKLPPRSVNDYDKEIDVVEGQ